MPLFGKKKADKTKSTRPKSQFFDVEHDEDALKDKNSAKRNSKSTFYEDLPSGTSHSSSDPVQSVEPSGAAKLQQDDGNSDANRKWLKRKSLLSCSFMDCLIDKEIIAYFIQFMTEKDRGHFVRFWLESQNFFEASTNRISSQYVSQDNENHHSQDNMVLSPVAKPPTSLAMIENSKSVSKGDGMCEDLLEQVKNDAVNIYSKYIALDCPTSIGITDDLRNRTISKICSEDGKVDLNCFRECQRFVEKILESEYFRKFLDSTYYRKYQIDILTSGRLQLPDILYNDSLMFYFMEFVEQENASTLLQFWMAVDNFQSQLTESCDYSSHDAQADAMIIYERYFSLQASEPLGFNDKVRTHVELNICQVEGPSPDCFLIPKMIILETIEKTLFHPFLQSQIYYRFLTELISSAKNPQSQHGTPKLKDKIHHRTGSSSSYDTQSLGGHSIREDKVSTSSSSNDVRSLKLDNDEQQLWKRAHHRKTMSLGHLNEFGQYISELDMENVPDLDKKKGNRFSRKRKEKEKAEEEMAWQVAKMIINDINKEVSQDAKTPSHTLSAESDQVTAL